MCVDREARSTNAIAITDEMIDAAVALLAKFDPSIDDPVRVADEILRTCLMGSPRPMARSKRPLILHQLESALFLDTD